MAAASTAFTSPDDNEPRPAAPRPAAGLRPGFRRHASLGGADRAAAAGHAGTAALGVGVVSPLGQHDRTSRARLAPPVLRCGAAGGAGGRAARTVAGLGAG